MYCTYKHNMEARSCNYCCRKKFNAHYIFWVFICSLSYSGCKAHALYYIVICGRPFQHYGIFPHYLINSRISEKLLNKKYIFIMAFNIRFYFTTCNKTTNCTLSSSVRVFCISVILSYTSPLCKPVYRMIMLSSSNAINNLQWLQVSVFSSGNHKTMNHLELKEKSYNFLKWNGKGSKSLCTGIDKTV
jgi:hypothetical protein